MNADKALELARLAYPNDENLRVTYMLGLNAGAEWQKAKMMEGAEECELYWDGDFLAIDLNMREIGYSEHDKVKIIVVKEE